MIHAVKFKKSGLLLLSAIFLVISITTPHFSFVIWFALSPFLVLLKDAKRFVVAFGLGLILGAAFFSAMFYWIIDYELRIFFLVLTFTIPCFGLFAFLTQWANEKLSNPIHRVFVPPSIWQVLTFGYALTPVETIGDQLAFLQAPLFPALIRTFGLAGLSFLVLLTNSAVALIVTEKNKKPFALLLAAVIIALLAASIPVSSPTNSKPIKLALIQHNFQIPSDWRTLHQREILGVYEKAIRDYGRQVDLIVFPQYGLPMDVLRNPEWLSGLSRLTKSSVLLATYIPKIPGGDVAEGERFDSALLFTPDGKVQEYRAVTPPPFRRIGQIAGTERRALMLNQIPIGTMLCYEDARPREGIEWVQGGAQILFALSNPGHFVKTRLPGYHLIQDRIRAIETGRFVIRVSPNGFSAVIDPNGKILTQSKLNEKRVLFAAAQPRNQKTLFTAAGHWFTPLVSVVVLFWMGILYWRSVINRRARSIR